MTKEEAITREEAIRRIKAWNLDSDDMEVLATIIPELVESEDERIRKWIYTCIESLGYPADEDAEKELEEMQPFALAWLEKQKEQKPVENGTRTKIISRATNEKQVVLLSESNGNAEISWDTRSLEDTKRLLEYGIAFINKQLGIKSSEWSEKDKEMLIKVGQIVLKHWNSLSDSFYHKHDDENEDAESCYNWIKYLPDRFNLELKQEWNKKDKQIINKIIEHLSEFIYPKSLYGEDVKECIDWLKSLRTRLKQEQQIKVGDKVSIHCRKDRNEDVISIYEGKVGKVIHVWDGKKNPWGHIGVSLDNGCNNGFYEDELEIFVEPHWKPSEEQMCNLKKAYESYYFCDGERPALESLYNDLQKLL